MKDQFSRRAVLGGGLALLAAPALAQQAAYPNRPVTIIVPFAPGGSTDFVARLLAQYLSGAMGGSFVVENRAGGSGTIGHGALARARPQERAVTTGCRAVPVAAASWLALLRARTTARVAGRSPFRYAGAFYYEEKRAEAMGHGAAWHCHGIGI